VVFVRTCRQFVIALACVALSAAAAHAGEGFSFEMPKERLRILIPDIPQMEMADHPNAAMQPHARYMGRDGTGYTISILTPTSDPGFGPEACAVSIFNSLMARYRLDPKNVTRRKVDANTFVVLFPVRMDPFVQFKAYVLSGYGGSHCLEVHASRMVSAADKDVLVEQLTAWFKGFHGARVEPM